MKTPEEIATDLAADWTEDGRTDRDDYELARRAAIAGMAAAREEIEVVDVVFDGPPAPESGRFIEVENLAGASIAIGEWGNRDDGTWALRLKVVR